MPNKWRLANYSFEPEVADAMRAAYWMVCAAPHLKDIGGALAHSFVPMSSPCAISHRASNIQRSAAGSRRVAVATLRRSIHTSTISLNCYAPSRQKA